MLRRPKEGWGVERAFRSLGTETTDAARPIEHWLDLLVQWNAKLDLTAAKTPEGLVDLMLTDAVELAKSIGRGVSVVDVGSGAGAPGLALALLRPDLKVTLVESLAKRTSFLRTVCHSLGRSDIAIEAVRAEQFSTRDFDIAISRATLEPSAWLALGIQLVRPGGQVYVLLARDEAPSDERASRESLVTYKTTGGSERTMAIYRAAV